ncbi:Serine 3-dehydrogenase [Mycobacterium simulans]|uniref:Serine 3-dehydrogenase n=1 Tax=Mycobacterium simulans TaxID=627089 RepID=A0A7Z7IMJ7_9MYCO|nr:SDR family NAD(P)-dependent oxidoreductase [Mycobacterium simulans]SOJ56371.1 Serine 3-dehydrogenase [Mycobacterium simulans]
MNNTAPVLITGCSSGVGRASALRFLRAGHPVYATARRPETLTALVEQGAVGLRLDVTDEESMVAAVKHVEADHGAVGILVNNAAYGLQGAVEAVLLDDLRAQFETNVFGLVRMTQLVLPGMRARRCGRIINLSSMGGHFTLPGSFGVHASKHAVEAISDGLRMEMRPFGIKVVIVEPGPIDTSFGETLNASLPTRTGDGTYARFPADVAARIDAAYEPKARNFVLSADQVAKTIVKAAHTRRPRTRYPVGAFAKFAVSMSQLMPPAVVDAFIRSQFPVPKPQ